MLPGMLPGICQAAFTGVGPRSRWLDSLGEPRPQITRKRGALIHFEDTAERKKKIMARRGSRQRRISCSGRGGTTFVPPEDFDERPNGPGGTDLSLIFCHSTAAVGDCKHVTRIDAASYLLSTCCTSGGREADRPAGDGGTGVWVEATSSYPLCFCCGRGRVHLAFRPFLQR